MKIQRTPHHHHHQKKLGIFLSQLLIIKDIQNLPQYIYVFEDDKKDDLFFKRIYVSPKLSKSKMATNYGQRIVLCI